MRAQTAAPGVADFQRLWLEIAYGRVRPLLGGVEVSAAEWFATFRACVILLRLGLPRVLRRLRTPPAWCGQALMKEQSERGARGARFSWGPASAEAASAFLWVVMPLLEATDVRELSKKVAPLARAAIDEGCFEARPLGRLAVPEVFAEAVGVHARVGSGIRSPWWRGVSR
ncbi:hypothetical protein ACIBJC_14830 [Streptomyces sp. NPDC050509]|uniref:hypothetical protein n=1 Tax=Streptomyces sp. NPDC050509 TaxID=3365620 RepID=UPI0037BA4E5E